MKTNQESNDAARMRALADSFPTLRGILDAWDPEQLDRWACSSIPGSGARNAACFVLSVWDRRDWECGSFDLHRALGCWDDKHRAAFLSWVKNPWWP